MKKYICTDCEKAFRNSKARQQHWMNTTCTFCHGHKLRTEQAADDKSVRMDVFESVAGDMPDGAYWAMAEEFGLSAEDFLP